MVPREFAYYRPTSVDEAVMTFHRLQSEGKAPVYYAGGTEILCAARLHELAAQAVIDIKGIPECTVLERRSGKLVIGAGVTLTQITECGLWPLLAESAGRVADHTTRGKITLGGNIVGKIPYREAVLPLLVADGEAVIAGVDGTRRVRLMDAFDRRLRLDPGELLVQAHVDERYLALPHANVKQTRLDWIDYPLLTVAALKADEEVRVAFAGVCEYPFRSTAIEADLNDRGRSRAERLDGVAAALPAPALSDIHGSAAYRMFVLRNTLDDILMTLEG